MSKPNKKRFPRQRLNQLKKKRRKAAQQRRRRQAANGLAKLPTATLSNTKCEWTSVEQETEARRQAVEEQIKVFRVALPILLKRLAQISDPRSAKTIKHKFSVVMLYGVLTFVYQMGSRREANRQMTMPKFLENLKLIFPELESLPHQDTLNRLLSGIHEPDQIPQALVDRVRHFIRNKKFQRYRIADHYPIAIDGTQKFTRENCWAAECLEREVGSKAEDGTKQPQFYVYVLEASLSFANGMTIPLMSEFLSYEQTDPQSTKQDCELRAFHRLAGRLKEAFPRLPILVLLDGLYPNGPVIERCRHNHWDFMMVLQDDSLPSVWEEVRGLGQLQLKNHLEQKWGNRQQRFRWVNQIEYSYADNRKHQTLHVVICEESWEEVDAGSARIVTKTSRHAWISARPLTRSNLHERCNLGARHRWGIEANILVEKRHGYQYEHCFSYNWNAMKGYHYLMRLAHFINVLVQNSARLARMVHFHGLRGLVQFLRDTCAAPWLDADRIRQTLGSPPQLRLE